MAFNETIPNNYIKEISLECASESTPSFSEKSNQQEIMNSSNFEKSKSISDLNPDYLLNNQKSKSNSKLSAHNITTLSSPHKVIKNKSNRIYNQYKKNIEIINYKNTNNSKNKIIKKKTINIDSIDNTDKNDNILLKHNNFFSVEI